MSEADCAPASGGAGASPASAGAAVERESKFIPIAGRPITAIVVGAGNRGTVYSNYALEVPARFKIVGVAEPRDWHREAMAKNHSIPADAVWKSWTELAAAGRRLADCVILTTQDRMHREPAVAFAALGYHILLEKPIAVSAEDVKAVVAAVKAAGVHFAVGHVLRFTPYMQRIIGLIRSGAIGEVVNIQHLEPIGAAHFSHSYVRGNWRNEAEASFMLLAKCCHDVGACASPIRELEIAKLPPALTVADPHSCAHLSAFHPSVLLTIRSFTLSLILARWLAYDALQLWLLHAATPTQLSLCLRILRSVSLL